MYDKTKVFPIREPEGGGGGSGDVTAAGNNTFTGVNTFENNVNLGKSDSIVTVNGTLQDGDGNEYVTRTDYASTTDAGVAKVINGTNGLQITENGVLMTYRAPNAQVKEGLSVYNPIVPTNQHQSTFYGLSKAAGANLSGSDAGETAPDGTNPGIYPDTAKTAIREMLGAAGTEELESGELIPKLAENMTPYAEDSGTTQTQPFFLEGTATGNGESRVDAKQVPAYAFLQEKRGNMVCVNQLIESTNFISSGGTVSTTGGVGTFIANASGQQVYKVLQVKSGHNYFISVTYKTMTATQDIKVRAFSSDYSGIATTSWQTKQIIATVVATGGASIGVIDRRTSDWDEIQIKDVICADLTRWFNGNIPAYLLSHPEAFGRYYKGSLAYEPGRLEPATGRYLTSVGRNIWDEEWEVGGLSSVDGSTYTDNLRIRSKNFIEVNSDTYYYFRIPAEYNGFKICYYDVDYNFIKYEVKKNEFFKTPSNCAFIKFAENSTDYGTAYNHDITISLYYPGESGYDKYYPHEVLATIDTGTEQLGFLDYKVPSGLITRPTGSVDFGTLNWNYRAPSTFYAEISGLKINTLRGICSKYVKAANKVTADVDQNPDKTFCFNTVFSYVNVKDSAYTDVASFKAAMSGVMLYYELATPTTEQGTPFQESVPIDDFGQLSWSDTDVPQGNQIFYPVDYKAYEDTLIKYTDGDATSLVRKTDYASSSEAGVVKVSSGYGLQMLTDGALSINYAGPFSIKGSLATYYPITPLYQHQSVFYGLSRAAGVNLASSTEETAPDGTNPGVYPAAAKTAIQNMLGITDLIGDINTVLDSVNGVVI